MFDQIFLSSQVKQSVIISNKHGIYELPHKLPNDLTYRILKNKEISEKSKNLLELYLVLSLPPKLKMFLILAKTF